MALDWSFEPAPDLKGGYHRRIEDVWRALDKFAAKQLPQNSPAQFIVYYFAAEKLAKSIVGIFNRKPAEEAYNFVPVHPPTLKTAAELMSLQISAMTIDALFQKERGSSTPRTAREIRDRLFHDFGPTQVSHVKTHATRLVPLMVRFITDDVEPVLKHLR